MMSDLYVYVVFGPYQWTLLDPYLSQNPPFWSGVLGVLAPRRAGQ